MALHHSLPDIQKTVDSRGIALDQVGVSDIKYPITLLNKQNELQHTIAQVSMSVGLPHQVKGTHMSRFIELISQHNERLTIYSLPTILDKLKDNLEAERAKVAISFPYFLERTAPISGMKALMDYQCKFTGLSTVNDYDLTIEVNVPIGSLCPCSKEISDYGAHNQRGEVTIQVKTQPMEDGTPSSIWIEDLVSVAEQAASSPLYPLLKRPDERYVTMQAYDKPAFVEDITRDVAQQLKKDERIIWYYVKVVNFESIHNHNAFAECSWYR